MCWDPISALNQIYPPRIHIYWTNPLSTHTNGPCNRNWTEISVCGSSIFLGTNPAYAQLNIMMHVTIISNLNSHKYDDELMTSLFESRWWTCYVIRESSCLLLPVDPSCTRVRLHLKVRSEDKTCKKIDCKNHINRISH